MDIKRSKTGLLLISLIITIYSLTGCEGPVGPMGPPGAEGPEGPEGPTAQTSSELLYVAPDYWETDTDDFMLSAVMESEIVDEEIATYGIVSVDYGTPGVEEWQPLPYTFVESNVVETFWYYPGYVEIVRYGDTVVPGIPVDTLIYKVSAFAK